MNIRQFVMSVLQKKSGYLPVIHQEDVLLIQQYMEPVKSLLGDDFLPLCDSIFTIYQTQLEVFVHDQSYTQNLLEQLKAKYFVSEAPQSPEAMAVIREKLKKDPIQLKLNLISQLLHVMPHDAFNQDLRMPIQLSDWLTQMVETRSASGSEALWSQVASLSLDQFRASYMIHSELPALTAALEKQEAEDSYNEKCRELSEDGFEVFKEKIVALYSEVEKEHVDVYAQPLIKKGYQAYQSCIGYLAKAKAAVSSHDAVCAVEEPFSHIALLLDEGSVVTDENFQQAVVEASKAKPVLLDVWASWCAPCKALSPIIDEIKAESPWLEVCKVEFERAPGSCESLGIKSLPTLLLFYQGKEVSRLSGFKAKADIISWVQDALTSNVPADKQ